MMNKATGTLAVPVAALLLVSGGVAWGQEAQPGVIPAALATNTQAPKEAVCAICGVREKAGPEPVAATLDYQGKTYFFCQEACKAEFQKDPQKWIMAAQTSTQGRDGVTRPATNPEGETGHQHAPAGRTGGGSSAPS